MKAAFWGIALVVMGVVGIVLVNLFGNITVTNQLNYTTMKNAVEASMYDALDMSYYRTGFCLCTNVSKNDSGKWSFKNDTEYELVDITHKLDGEKNDIEECKSSKKYCEVLKGEYRINKRVFAESLIRRFAEMVNNDKDYEIVIQDIIEYPPKVSVRIDSEDDEFLPTDQKDGYVIVNQMDAIIEVENSEEIIDVSEPKPTPKPTPTPAIAVVDPQQCYRNSVTGYYEWGIEENHPSSSWKRAPSITTKAACTMACYRKATNSDPPYTYDWKLKQTYSGWTQVTTSQASTKDECRSACYMNKKDNAKHEWGYPKLHPTSSWIEQKSITKKADCKAEEVCYRKSTNSDPPYTYEWKAKSTYSGWEAVSTSEASNKNECREACYNNKTDGAKYEWGYPKDHPSSSWTEQTSIKKKADCKRPASVVSGSCTWHYLQTTVTCTKRWRNYECVAWYPNGRGCAHYDYKDYSDTRKYQVPRNGGYSSCEYAKAACEGNVKSRCPSGYTASGYNCIVQQTWTYTNWNDSKYTASRYCGGGIPCTTMKRCYCDG